METDKHTEITPQQKEPRTLFRHLCRYKKLTVLALWILGALVITFLIRHESVRIYDYQSFRSEYARQAEEKKVTDNAAIHGIYLFGPYISLPRGQYEFVVNYDGDTDFKYEVTCSMGKEQLCEGILKANTQKTTFSLDVQESIEDRSVEFRTYYDGKGTFDFHSLEVRRGGWIRKAAIAIGLMSLAMAVLFFLYRGISLPGALYTVLFYGAASLSLTSDLRIGFFIVLTQMLWLALVLKVPFFRKEIRHVQAYEVLMLILTSFLVISAVNIIRYNGGVENLDFVKNIVPEYYVLEMVGTAHILALLRLCVKNRSCSSWVLLISAFFFGFTCILHGRDVYFAIGVSVILGFFIYYLLKSDPGMLRRTGGIRSYRGPFIAVCIMSAVLTAYFVCITVCRYRTFSSANFDMGIFCQMYEYMAKTGLPMTTSERGYLLSHFYIHFSPVFYLFLPVYMLFRSPECLLVIQSVLVFTAVIPLFLICRHYRLKPFTAMLVSFVYLVMPATQEPLFYDFHEYKFIPFFLFWFIYLYLEHKNLRAFIFLFLTLAIKEDLAIYLVVFALYLILAEKDYKRGAVVLTISLLYFAGVMAFIQSHGMGLMEGHYKMYYLSGERGVFALAKNIILAPGRFVRQVFDEENFKYIFYTLGVLAFVPLKAGDFKRLTLLLPYVAFGLMTDYAYQHDVGFQYVYGSMSLIMLLFILNLKDMDKEAQHFVCLTCICAGILLSYTYKGDGYIRYIRNYRENREMMDDKDAFLKSFTPDGSVTADSFLVPHLSHLEELYDYNASLPDSDYYILNASSEYSFDEVYAEKGYTLIDEQYGLRIFRKE